MWPILSHDKDFPTFPYIKTTEVGTIGHVEGDKTVAIIRFEH